jgi:hypothetical protein
MVHQPHLQLVRLFRQALLAPPDNRLWKRSFVNFILSVCLSMALVVLIVGVGRMFGYFEIAEGNPFELSTLDFLGVVFFAPLLETFLLSGLLAFLSILKKPIPVIAAISACIWGALHGIAAPLWFFGTVFGFFVFSCAYLTWRPRSYWYGFAAAALPHAMQNLLVFSMVGLLE